MSEIVTFDPTTCGSAPECVEGLRELGIKVNQKVAARLYALGQFGIQFSLAVLNDVEQPGPMQDLLQRREWLRLGEPSVAGIEPLLDDLCEVLEKNGIFQVVSPDEAMVARSIRTLKGPSSLLPSVLGKTDVVSLRHDLLWDRKRLEKSSLTLLDGEDEDELLADFRYLFRAIVSHKQDPTTLLITAFGRHKSSLSLEAARLVREQLDPKLGSLLEQMFSSSLTEVKRALQSLASEPYEMVRGRFLTTLIANLWQRPEVRPLVLSHLRVVSPRLAEDRPAQQQLLEQLLGDLGELLPPDRAQLTEDIVEWVSHNPGLTQLLTEHLERSLDADRIAFLTQLVALLPLNPAQTDMVEQKLVQLFYEFGQLGGMLERLRAPLRRLGPEALLRLLEDQRRLDGTPTAKTWLLQMADTLLQEQPHAELTRELDAFAVSELTEGSRSGLLALIRTQRLNSPGVAARLKTLQSALWHKVLQFLLLESERLEAPDDEGVLELLGTLGEEPLQLTYDRLTQDSAVGSGAAATTLLRLARMLTASRNPNLFVDVNSILVMPIFGRRALPSVWDGLARLGTWSGSTSAQRERIFAILIGEPPEVIAASLARLHSGSQGELRVRIEDTLLEWLADATPRKLRSALEAWMLIVQEPEVPSQASQLLTVLCRILIRRSALGSLDTALKNALADDPLTEDGTRRRPAWDKGDRDQALQILGLLAVHPALDEHLFSMLVTRLFSFTEEWLLQIEKGRNLYENRTTPLWDLLDALPPRARVQELSVALCMRLLEVQENAPHHLQLEHRDDVLRFLTSAIRNDLGSSGPIDLPRQLLELLIRIAQGTAESSEPSVAVYFVRQLKTVGLRPNLQRLLDA